MVLTRQQLLLDLYQAFYDARRGKSSRSYVIKWEKNLKDNMELLCDDLFLRRYKPLPSKCFIIDYPKKREIFAAMFRDRIVHHLYFNYTHELFERTFIQDSYSCIKERGTHYGISRIRDFARKASENWQRPCYAIHLDIRGYFMHINRRSCWRYAGRHSTE
jgi:retron-type reverse transcriptase